MPKVQIVLTGDKALNKKLRELAGNKPKQIIRKAARTALQPVQSAAKRFAPRDSGALQKSIRVRTMKRSRSGVGARVTTSESDNAFKGAQFYGAFLEFGWTPGKRKSTKRGKPVPGELYMRRAVDAKKASALVLYRHAIISAINSIAK